ncbi:MAG: hypothetical protein S4CHLAM37_10380 [Chlamydiia bacterium]|nr:hypothetical protein [Chlamydiia bacterium]
MSVQIDEEPMTFTHFLFNKGAELELLENLENKQVNVSAAQKYAFRSVKNDKEKLVSELFQLALTGAFFTFGVTHGFSTFFLGCMAAFGVKEISFAANYISSLYQSFRILNPEPILHPANA